MVKALTSLSLFPGVSREKLMEESRCRWIIYISSIGETFTEWRSRVYPVCVQVDELSLDERIIRQEYSSNVGYLPRTSLSPSLSPFLFFVRDIEWWRVLGRASQAEGGDAFSEFHLYVCLSFLVKWSEQLRTMDFQVSSPLFLPSSSERRSKKANCL